MEDGGPSVTARRVAAHRLGFARVVTDYGDPSADEALAADVAAGQAAPANRMHDYLAARTSFFDRTVVGAIDRGVQQVVVGAAGYEGRAFRYAKPGVRWFEIDHPATQRDELARLGRLGIAASGVRFAEADFTRDPVAARLRAAGLDAGAPSLFLLEGARSTGGAVTDLTAEDEAAAMVAAVRDDPARRLELAARFYDRRAGRPGIRSYRRAELAFMRWQISRGILAAPTADRPGSPWWRAVNEGLLRDAWQAQLLVSGQPGTASRPGVACWVRFLRRPSAEAWYRAHNASVVAGYLDHRDLAWQEHPVERFFMDVALIRVLYAHSLLTAPRLALGRFAPAGRLLADPRWRGADMFLSLRRILPNRYPLDGSAVEDLLDAENYLGRLVDYGVILPRAAALYAHAASELNEPRLLEMLRDGRPVYAWPYDAGHVWTTAKAPRAIRTLRSLTRNAAADPLAGARSARI